MRNSANEVKDANIRLALRDADCKGRMSIVAAVTGIREKALREILDGEFDIPDRARIVLSAHLA